MRAFLVFLILWALPVHAQPEVRQSLLESTQAWNRGDLEGFMRGYVNTPEMTFTAGGRLVRGYEALRDRYQATYGTNRDSMGQLRFEDIEIWPLGPDHALAVGRWILELKKEANQGVFSLVMRKTPDGWKILHDHTSRLEKEKK